MFLFRHSLPTEIIQYTHLQSEVTPMNGKKFIPGLFPFVSVVNAFCSMNNFPLNSKMHSMLWQWHTRQKTPHTRISFVHHIKSQRHRTHASNMYGTQSMPFIKPINLRNLKLNPKCDRCTKNHKKTWFEIQSKIDFEPGVFPRIV